ncbi:efflux RND transporter periplasmic adaptor subunit [bacterium]|nr:efflux RND transporter periplasmic adaptor subunit [bacterium]
MRQATQRTGSKASVLCRFLFLPAVIVLSLGLSGCSEKQGQADDSAQTQLKDAVPVDVVRVAQTKFQRTVEYPATIAATKQVTLVSKVQGEVLKVHVLEGDHVRKGQALIELDPVDFQIALKQAEAQRAAAQSGVEVARANVQNIEKNYNRMLYLFKQNAVAERDFDQVEAGYKVATAQLEAAKSQLQIWEASVEAAKTNLVYTVIRAPFDGIIGSRLIDEGTRTSAAPPTSLLVLLDVDRVKLIGGISERDIPNVKPGQPAKIYVDALSLEPIPAQVDRIEPMVDPKTRIATVRVLVANEQGTLKVGMSARVIIEENEYEAPALPEDAVVRMKMDTTQGSVMIVEGTTVKKREVVLGARQGTLVEIASGVSGNEVVVRGHLLLSDGQTVRVVSGQEE